MKLNNSVSLSTKNDGHGFPYQNIFLRSLYVPFPVTMVWIKISDRSRTVERRHAVLGHSAFVKLIRD